MRCEIEAADDENEADYGADDAMLQHLRWHQA